MQPLTMKQWAINCLVKGYLEENYGVEIVVHKKKEPIEPEVVDPKQKKKWAVTFSR